MNHRTASDILAELDKDDLQVQLMLEEERINADCAQIIYDARKAKGLSQADLARLVGTSQAAIARFEDADYGGRTLRMMVKIAHALQVQFKVTLEGEEKQKATSQAKAVSHRSTGDGHCNNYAFAA